MQGYYEERLSAERLRRCYELAPPRVRQYLRAEVEHVAGLIRPTDTVLELGCGYGRVLGELSGEARSLVGIDSSPESLKLAVDHLAAAANCTLAVMDAGTLGFTDGVFDVVLCIQNGVSAFKVDRVGLIAECIRVTRPGGTVLLSSYAAKFWEDRLAWFQLQSDHGLLGEIDHDATRDGEIVCKDGFTASTVTPEQFEVLARGFDVDTRIVEVDESSVFCELRV